MRSVLLASLLVVAVPGACRGGEGVADEEVWLQELAAGRAQRDLDLRSETGYLALVGLWWLEDGVVSVGSSPACQIRLPRDAPPQVGRLAVGGGRAVFEVTAEDVLVGGQELDTVTLLPDEGVQVEVGRFAFWLIERSGQLGLRLRDPRSPILRDFPGVDFFPPAPSFRKTGRFVPHDEPVTVSLPNVMGTRFEESSPGVLVFEHDGEEHRLVPTLTSRGDFFVVFGDATNGAATYGGGRFLRVSAPDEDGRVTIDFNWAYNPPCAYSPYTTCPRPLPENLLPFPVEAGERAPAEG